MGSPAIAPACTGPGRTTTRSCPLPSHGRGAGPSQAPSGPSPSVLGVQLSWNRIPLAGCCYRVQLRPIAAWERVQHPLPAPGVLQERGRILCTSRERRKPART